MNPKLFKAESTEFDGEGYGSFTRCVKCHVNQELGSTGVYDLEMTILADDPLLSILQVGSIIAVNPNMTDPIQAFVVEEISKKIDAEVDIYATHIAQHRAKLIPVAPVTANNLTDAITDIMNNSLETNPFSLETKRTSLLGFNTIRPMSFREILGGTEGSLLDVYSGEYIFDNYTITFVTKRGRDDGVVIAAGQNMTGFELIEEFAWNDSATGVLGYYYTDEDGLVSGTVQYCDDHGIYPYEKTVTVDFTDVFESVPTANQVDVIAKGYISTKGYPQVNLDVAFDHYDPSLRQKIRTMQLGDTVHISNPTYNTITTSRIVAMDYDVLAEQYNSITIGTLKANINKVISEVKE